MAKHKKESKAQKAKEVKEEAKEAAQMPSGSPMAPGPINNPEDHPVNNMPQATDPRWAEQLSPSQVPGGY